MPDLPIVYQPVNSWKIFWNFPEENVMDGNDGGDFKEGRYFIAQSMEDVGIEGGVVSCFEPAPHRFHEGEGPSSCRRDNFYSGEVFILREPAIYGY